MLVGYYNAWIMCLSTKPAFLHHRFLIKIADFHWPRQPDDHLCRFLQLHSWFLPRWWTSSTRINFAITRELWWSARLNLEEENECSPSTITLLIYHLWRHAPLRQRAYFLSNALQSTDRKYICKACTAMWIYTTHNHYHWAHGVWAHYGDLCDVCILHLPVCAWQCVCILSKHIQCAQYSVVVGQRWCCVNKHCGWDCVELKTMSNYTTKTLQYAIIVSLLSTWELSSLLLIPPLFGNYV